MALTNTVVEIKRKTSTGSGAFGKTSLGDFSVWLEQDSVAAQRRVGSVTNELSIPQGTIFLFSDIDLTDCFVTIDSADRPITAFDRYIDRKGNFHHIEASYSY